MACFADRLRRWTRSSECCASTGEIAEVRRLAEVLKSFSKGSLRQAVVQNCQCPLLLSYAADGTPLRLKKDFVEGSGDHVVRRRGGHPTELLVMRGFLLGVVTAGGPSVRRAYIRDPVLMSLGKTAEHHYGAMVGSLGTLSEMGAKSICIHHYSWDGAMYTAIRKMIQARHALPHKRLEGGSEDGGAWLRAFSGLADLHQVELPRWVVGVRMIE